MPRRLVLVPLLACLLVSSACAGSDAESAASTDAGSTEPFRAIETIDDQGRPYLSPQDVDPAVSDVQQQFADWGLPAEISGVYDDETLAIVMAFQYSQELVPDGVIGPNTWDALDDPEELPEDVDPLTLIEIATVALTSPSDARTMLVDEGLPLPVASPEEAVDAVGDAAEGEEPTDGDDGPEADVSEPMARAVVELGEQQVYLYNASGAVTHQFSVSSGRDGLTPVGTFSTQSESDTAWASADSSITMKWMTRFNGGIGFHGIPVKDGVGLETPLGERPVSAGCIRMDDSDAKTLQDVLPIGAEVVVRG